MSMIALAQRLRPGPRGLGHALLMLIAVTAAIIIGLLAMHTLNSRDETPAPASAAAAIHDLSTTGAGVTDHGATQPTTDGECADCGGHAGMLAMACVLALLIVSVLLFRPLVGFPWGAARCAVPIPIGRAAVPPRPPPLLVLCISRT